MDGNKIVDLMTPKRSVLVDYTGLQKKNVEFVLEKVFK